MGQVKSQCIEFNLTMHEKAKISNYLSEIKYDSDGSDDYLSKLKMAAYKCFPINIIKNIERAKSHENIGYIIINNLPVDKHILKSTYSNGKFIPNKSGSLSENVLVAISLMFGEPYTVKSEGEGLVNNIIPYKNHANKFTGLGSEAELDLHIENAALKFLFDDDCSPASLILFGISEDLHSQVNTYLANAYLALQLLDEQTINILRTPLFNIKLPYRWRDVLQMQMTDDVPLISGSSTFPRIHAVFYSDMIYIKSVKAQEAASKFYAALKQISVGIQIKKGQLVYINNRFVLHARDKFKPTYDENGVGQRWLQRVFVSQDIWNMREFRLKGRIYDPSLLISK